MDMNHIIAMAKDLAKQNPRELQKWDEMSLGTQDDYIAKASEQWKGRKMEPKAQMGQNAGDVNDTLKQRGQVYGSYEKVIETRATIMDALKAHHKQATGDEMSATIEVAFGDLVLKLVRGAGAPYYPDSFHDLAGYAKLMEDMADEDRES